MEDSSRKSLSKFMALILRHAPKDFGLTLDTDGFVKLNEVARVVANKKAYRLDEALANIKEVVAKCDKGRYEIDGDKIRAKAGHSVEQKIKYTQVEPPEFLYHGTSAHNIDAIKKNGLRSMKRQYVHLSTSREVAKSVGQRHDGTTVILVIKAQEAHKAGVKFYNPQENLFLTEALPKEHIAFDELHFTPTGRFGKIADMA